MNNPVESFELQRINPYQAAPDALRALLLLDTAVAQLGIERELLDLVKLRASQINGCAYYVDLIARDARKHGESERRLDVLAMWRDTPFFTLRERAALAWTESLTLIAETHAPDEDFERLGLHFSDSEMVDLTVAIGAINAWNRLSIGFRRMPLPEGA
jgi:AhpD family alkylhydroperoxidase